MRFAIAFEPYLPTSVNKMDLRFLDETDLSVHRVPPYVPHSVLRGPSLIGQLVTRWVIG